MTSLVPPFPSLHHAQSLDQLYNLASPLRSCQPYERRYSSNLNVEQVEWLNSSESIDQRSWRVKRKMSIPNISRPQRQSSPDTHITSDKSKPCLSLSSLIPNSRLLRRLSTSPTSPQAKLHHSTPPAAQLQSRSVGSSRVSLDTVQPRPAISRSSTMPSIGDSGWTLVEKCGTLSEEPTESTESQETLALARSNDHLVHTEPQSIFRRINTSTPCLPIPQTVSAPVSPSPCQRVWLCTPPKPSTSPCSLSTTTNTSRRRPAITTRALSHASLAKTFDENGAIMYVSGHSEKILTLPGVKQGVSCWREKYACCPIKKAGQGGLMRTQSAMPDLAHEHREAERPGLIRAETTGSIRVGKDEGGMVDSASGEPLLNEEGGKKRNKGRKGLSMGM